MSVCPAIQKIGQSNPSNFLDVLFLLLCLPNYLSPAVLVCLRQSVDQRVTMDMDPAALARNRTKDGRAVPCRAQPKHRHTVSCLTEFRQYYRPQKKITQLYSI